MLEYSDSPKQAAICMLPIPDRATHIPHAAAIRGLFSKLPDETALAG